MIRIIISVIISLGLILIIYLKKRKKEKKCFKGISNYDLGGDYDKVKNDYLVKCLDCGECLLESSGCCGNCNQQQFITEKKHCHNSEHSHHEHNHNHSHQVNINEYFSLLLIPLVILAILYRIIDYISSKLWMNYKNF